MTSIAVCLVSHNELGKRGEAALRRSLDSLSASMDFVARHRPGVDVYVACCDDASTDQTPEYIDGYFRGKAWFKLVRNQTNQFAGFQAGFFAKLVPNVRKLGLLDANNGHLRQKWGEAGLLEFEFADDTGSDYETYDEVAKDRAARAAS